jgi:hypothetical protein
MTEPTIFCDQFATYRVYAADGEKPVRIEVEVVSVDANGTILLESNPCGLAFGVQGRYDEDQETGPYIGRIDLFYVENPSFDDPLRANNPQINIYRAPGADEMAFIHLRPDGPVVSFESDVKSVGTPNGSVYGCFDHA